MLDGIYLSQEKYIQDLTRVALNDHHTVDTPMELGVHLRATDGESLADPTRYHHLVWGLGVAGPSVCLRDSATSLLES